MEWTTIAHGRRRFSRLIVNWVYFVSDRDGKLALYRMQVEDLVEAT